MGTKLGIRNTLTCKTQPATISNLLPVLWIQNLGYILNGYFLDNSINRKRIEAATTLELNDSLIMPANDPGIIAALNAAGLFNQFYADNANPKKVLITDIASNYNVFKDDNTLIVFRPDSDFLQAFTDDNVYIKEL